MYVKERGVHATPTQTPPPFLACAAPRRHDPNNDSGYESTPENRRPHTLPLTTANERWMRPSPETTPTDGRTQLVHGRSTPVRLNNGQLVAPDY
jgi:hypothetical protein